MLPPILSATPSPYEIKEDLTVEVKLMRVLDHNEKELRNKKIPMVIVLWRSSQVEKETWERKSEIRKKYLEFFLETGMNLNFGGEILKR